MAVDAVQKNEYKTQRASYVKAGVYGAVGGYALKGILPLNQEEKDDKFVRDFVNGALGAQKSKRIDNIRNLKEKTAAQDEFIKLVDNKPISASKVKGYQEPLKSQILEVIAGVNDAARELKSFSQKAIVALTKLLRPSKTFMAAGAGIAIATAFVYNVLGKISED